MYKIKGKTVKYCVTKLSSQSINKLGIQAILMRHTYYTIIRMKTITF